MAETRFHGSSSLEWQRLGDLYPPEMQGGLSTAHAESAICTHEPGLDGSLHLQEYKWLPNADVNLHAHDEPEIIYIIEGSLKVGNRTLDAGSSVFIGADTLYAFKAGDEGCRLLIFMATGIYKYFTKDTLIERHTELRTEAAE